MKIRFMIREEPSNLIGNPFMKSHLVLLMGDPRSKERGVLGQTLGEPSLELYVAT